MFRFHFLRIVDLISWCELLMHILDISPNLQVLKLMSQIDPVYRRKRNHLETFVWTCYEGKLEIEKEVAKYILRNASRLKKATFSIIESNPGERDEMIEELESVVRASQSCQLIFK